MKVCSKCKQKKIEKEFYKNSKRKDGKQTWCKQCAIQRRIEHYKENKVHYGNYTKQYRQETRNKIKYYLQQHPCIQCKEIDPIVLEFDHLKDKEYNVADMVGKFGWDRIKKEINKCQVLCANCHRRKTYLQTH